MHWVAVPEKDAVNGTLETGLWAAADQLRANSGLNASQYSQPVLGLIFLRFADVSFTARRAQLEKAAVSARRGPQVEDPSAYHERGVLYLAGPNRHEKFAGARFDNLLDLPEGAAVGSSVNDAMRAIERDNPQLAGVLPKTYEIFDGVLLKGLLKMVSEIPATLEGDAFGRVYEYFIGQFARTEGQRGGEFYTPRSIVRLLVEVLEPFHGRILDPAAGSGGMFVQSARFVAEHKRDPSAELSIFGQEKVASTVALARMNLAVHGLDAVIKEANSYYEDTHRSTGKFDFVLANPPFNVDGVDRERLASENGPGRRYPFGLPQAGNANYLWIQLFWSALNARGRAGFVMANSAADAHASEQEIRRKLVESRAVDVMIAVGPNMFYTVTLPCTLWFFDRRKKDTVRAESVLFVDARHIYRQIDRARRDWTNSQIGFLANIVRLYRGEALDFTVGGDEAKSKVHEVFGKRPSFANVPGLCKAATVAEIAAQGWSLNPGRYVAIAPGETVTNEEFKAQLEPLVQELETLGLRAHELEAAIARSTKEILES